MNHFASDIRQFTTADKLKQHLSNYNPDIASWATGATIHHTWSPVTSQWKGKKTLLGIQNYFSNHNGWDKGPHLFLATNSPNPADDGIWQLTPLNLQGIHAVSTNRCHWGIEVVGDYNKQAWPLNTQELVYNTILALFNWRNIKVSTDSIKGHRETGSPKTCPGTAIDMNKVRADLIQRQSTL